MSGKQGDGTDLAPNIRENFNPRKKWADAVRVIAATRKFQRAGSSGRRTPLDGDDSDDSGGFKTADDDEDEAAAKDAKVDRSVTPGSSATASKTTTMASVVGALRKSGTEEAEDGVRNLSVN